METRKTKELRVRVRRIKVNSSTNCSPNTATASLNVDAVASTSSSCSNSKKADDMDAMDMEVPCTSKKSTKKATSNASSPSTASDGDDFATVHFKLAAALEAAAAHATSDGSSSGSGSAGGIGATLLDWQSMKAALMTFKLSSLMSDEKKSEGDGGGDVLLDTDDRRKNQEDCLALQASVVPEGATTIQTQLGSVLLTPRRDSDSSSSSTSSSDEDDDVPEILLVGTPEPNACNLVLDADRSSSMLLSKLPFSDPGVSVVDDKNPTAALSKILSLPPFDPHAPHLQVQLIIKNVVSLTQLSLREDNVIEVDIKKSLIEEFAVSKKHRTLSPFMDISNIHVKHINEEFFTFCSCKNCLKYREIVIHIMVEQFKTAHMVVMLLDVLIKAYGPMLKNRTAYNKFEKLLDANKEVYWIACGFVYNKKAEHMDFIYDDSLSDNMIFVLFSSILMVNNPLLLLQILAFHVECIVKAYAEGFIEIVEFDNNKVPAEEMLTYILDGYEDLCRISEQISCYLFAFENDFLRKFNLTWTLLCQRLYQLHVYSNLTDTMLACIITLKEDELTSRHATLIKKYIQFDDKMTYVEKRWSEVWNELNKFNLSEAERKRRKCLLNVHRIFDTVVQDAIAFSLQEFDDDNDFYDFQCLENRRLAWQNIMAYTKMKWPDGFFKPPNTTVCDDKCKKCNVLLEYHKENCKCITCSIAGGPLPPRRNSDQSCYKCLAQSLIEKEVNLYESKILNVCTSDDFLSFVRNNSKRKNASLDELGEEVCSSLTGIGNDRKTDDAVDLAQYHISWAVFQHFNNRKRYRHAAIEEKYFCKDCTIPACLLARKILNNEVTPTLSQHLVQYYQPLSMSIEELRAILPNIMFYNRKMIAFNIGFDLTDVHDLVVKIYWTFIISLYARYFMEFDLKCPLNLTLFELANNDIRLCMNKLVGNKDDTKFAKFLDKIKSLSPFKSQVESDFAFTVDVNTEEIQKKLDELLNFEDNQRAPLNDQIPPPVTTNEPASVVEDHPKKNCKEKLKKCCFDHSDLGDHCKENHSSKKRIKKECNHARMNETRDRLRKKLSQLVNARKNMKAAAAAAGDPQQQLQQNQSAASLPSTSTHTKQPPSLKAVAKAAAVATANNSKAHTSSGKAKVVEDDDDSLVCLSTLCKRISHLHMNASSPSAATSGKSSQQQPAATASATTSGAAAAATPQHVSNKKAASAATATATATGSPEVATPPTAKKSTNSGVNAAAWEAANREVQSHRGSNAKNGAGSEKGGGGGGVADSRDLSVLSVYLNSYSKEFLDNYSRDQSKVRKWINETLSYIEGSSGGSSTNGKKPQPQTSNPKKAAKKAKQKQRKEEEKRIMELQDLRGQFHDIYFKEFTDKQKLKFLKSNKKRDKKQIGELEANIKKLQRAKAKVETVILELIATVKQTNTEFKFSYLPTKEQQIEKLKALEDGANATATVVASGGGGGGGGANINVTSDDCINNLNVSSMVSGNSNYVMPASTSYPPYPMDFQSSPQGGSLNAGNAAAGATGFGMIRAPMPTPMCYAPPPHQTLAPDVVAAMAANAACNSNTDPSKRIVTIRRVNLPNVPEPRVTVTAKGSSPDKDKLLYTFVNGQLVPTTTPPPMTQLPMQNVSNANANEPRVTLSARAANTTDKDKLLYTFVNGQLMPTAAPPPMTQLPLQQIPLPLPMQAPPPPPPPPLCASDDEHLSLTIPPPPLTKSQLKKERRRAAKLAAEAEAAAKAAAAAAAEAEAAEEQHMRRTAQQRASKDTQIKTAKKSAKSKAAEAAVVERRNNNDLVANSKSKTKNAKNAVTHSASTTSVSTVEAAEGAPTKGAQAKMKAPQRRSVSTTTSCSVATSLSATPVNSEMNTRENSVSSQKPKALATEIGKKGKSAPQQNMQMSASKTKAPASQTKKQKGQQKEQKLRANKEKANSKQAAEADKIEQMPLLTPLPEPTPSSTTEAEAEQKERKKHKKERIRRPPLIDNGQFDNNPFATLHTQDSESEWDSTSSYSDESGSDTDDEQPQQQQQQQQTPSVTQQKALVAQNSSAKSKITAKPSADPETKTSQAQIFPSATPSKAKTKVGEQKAKESAASTQQNTAKMQNKKSPQYTQHKEEVGKNQKQASSAVTQQQQQQQPQQATQTKQRAAAQPQRRADKDRERDRDRDRDRERDRDLASSKGKGKAKDKDNKNKHITADGGGGGGGARRGSGAIGESSHKEISTKASRQSSRQQKAADNGVPKQMQSQAQQQDQPRSRGGRGNRGGGGGGGGGDTGGTGSDSRTKRGGGRYERNSRGSGGGGGNLNQSLNSSRHSAEFSAQQGSAGGDAKPLSKRAQRQAQRNKKFQKQQQHLHHNYEDCGAGIPNHMGYFNPDEVVIPPAPQMHDLQQQQLHQQHLYQQQQQQQQQQQHQYQNLPQQLQALHIGGNLSVKVNGQQPLQPSYASVSNGSGANNGGYPGGMVPALSIMDQLNRGVQVENLSLPPGITLTKVDPEKSELLRQKSESIRKLSKPLQQQQSQQQQLHAFQHQKAGATIIAPPVAAPIGSYYCAGAPYAGVAAAAAALEQSGIIMVEANPSRGSSNNNNTNTTSTTTKKGNTKGGGGGAGVGSMAAPPSGKTSKSKKRRNKSKQESNARAAAAAAVAANAKANLAGGGGGGAGAAADNGTEQPKMITLRNPMFHGGAASAAATILQQQSGLLPGRPLGGLPVGAPLPMDQPAAIIKNENGMFTIRNPALHQAVTNGLTLGGYRQFGNVNYYTPQEAAAEAVRATQLQQQQQQQLQQQQQQQQQMATNQALTTSNNNNKGSEAVGSASASISSSSSAFSYFSNTNSSNTSNSAASSSSGGSIGVGAIGSGSTHNNISISCTSIDDHGNGSSSTALAVGNSGTGVGGGGLTGDAAVIQRPTPQPKCISAIGSEIKNAQQQKQKCKENAAAQWTPFVGQELQNSGVPGPDNLAAAAAAAAYLGGTGNGCVTNATGSVVGANVVVGGAGVAGVAGVSGGCLTSTTLQEKYQQSSYYNGFVGHSSNTGSLFDGGAAADCHLHHHNCGEDSPPPTITGYNSYLDGITNTGVIRYDDASFLKNLIPGQNLSNEVSIHNINDSNFTRNTSPVAHRVDITPVFRSRPTSTTTNIYEQHCATANTLGGEQQRNYHAGVVPGYSENISDFGKDAGNIFQSNNLVNLNELDAAAAVATATDPDVDSYQRYNYKFENQQQQQQKSMLDLNDLLIKKSPRTQRASPYLDETAMDSFVQNINNLQISAGVGAVAGATTSAATAINDQCNTAGVVGVGVVGGHINGGNGGGGNVGGSGTTATGTVLPGATATPTAANGWW